MPTGLKVPVRVNKSGGAAIETNESEQLKKLILLALSEGGDLNPFQSLGISPDIFSIKDAAFRGRAKRAVEDVLAKFEALITLNPTKPLVFDDSVEGEVTVTFEYIDLQTHKVNELTASFVR